MELPGYYRLPHHSLIQQMVSELKGGTHRKCVVPTKDGTSQCCFQDIKREREIAFWLALLADWCCEILYNLLPSYDIVTLNSSQKEDLHFKCLHSQHKVETILVITLIKLKCFLFLLNVM
ncbi:hypothetical protein Lal_00009296 [Lupinus albus]|nr:hypothetical protein Lal_00009296 [Lupinus albus]